jgi:hypothetical protein
MLTEVITHARAEADKSNDPKAGALLETTAEVLQGLVSAYRHCETASEKFGKSNASPFPATWDD